MYMSEIPIIITVNLQVLNSNSILLTSKKNKSYAELK